MTSITPFRALDILEFGAINLDVLTENYQLEYYLGYLLTWPSLLFKACDIAGKPVAYMIGKSEGRALEWHSHVTALTVHYVYRRLGLARTLIKALARASDAPDQKCYFMDLYVRTTNAVAIEMYTRMGFDIFRRVVDYYSQTHDGNNDAFDMRMPLKLNRGRNYLERIDLTEEIEGYEYRYGKSALNC